MSNTLTNLVPDLYEALDIVSREMVGFIPAVTLDAQAERAALNQNIRIPLAPASTSSNVTPGQLPPDDGDQTIDNISLSITKSKMVPFRWNGEEQKGVNSGAGYANIRRDQIAQAIRTLVNEIEADVATLAKQASRAYGTAGVAPFASDLSDPAQVLKILKDNGAAMADLQLVIDTTAGAKMRTLAQLTKANEAGTTDLRARGVLLDIHGFKIRESAGVGPVTAGTAAGGTMTGAGAAGATSVTITTGSGASVAILKGDIVNFAGDTNKYVAAADCTIGASTTGTLTLNKPGLRTTISGAALTVTATSTRNLAFARSALVLATRAPALPEEGDMADDRMLITDPVSGMTFEFSMYKQYRRVRYEVAAAWGQQNIKSEHSAILLG